MISTKSDSLPPLFQEFRQCSPLQASLNSVESLTVLSLPLALIFQAILVDQVALVSALVVQLAFAQMFAMTTTNAPTISAFQDRLETDAHLLPSLALTEIFAPPILVILQLLEDAFSPTLPAMTTTNAQMTIASNQPVARASKRSVTTEIFAHKTLAIPQLDVSSLLFPLLNATCADLLFALQFLAAPSDAKMELALPLQFLAMTEMLAPPILAIQPLELANTHL